MQNDRIPKQNNLCTAETNGECLSRSSIQNATTHERTPQPLNYCGNSRMSSAFADNYPQEWKLHLNMQTTHKPWTCYAKSIMHTVRNGWGKKTGSRSHACMNEDHESFDRQQRLSTSELMYGNSDAMMLTLLSPHN